VDSSAIRSPRLMVLTKIVLSTHYSRFTKRN
jgi:hypothetical protein